MHFINQFLDLNIVTLHPSFVLCIITLIIDNRSVNITAGYKDRRLSNTRWEADNRK